MNVRIKSWWLFVCLLLYCFVPFSGQAEDAGKTIQTITVVSDDNYPPYIFRDFNGDIQGILVDEWKLWEKKTGLKVNLIAMDWSKAQESLLKGQADVIDTIFFTEKRAKQYDFTKPYATINVPVFFHKNLAGIVDIASLKGFTIGVKKGDACIEVFKKHGITSLQEYDSYEAIVKATKDRQIKVFSIDKPPALYYLYKMNLEDDFRYSLNLYTGKFHRAVIKGRTDILKIVEDGFSLITKKEHNAIEKKWMGEPLARPAYLRYILFSFLFAGLLFLMLVFLNITLRRKVRSKTSKLQDLVNQLRLSEGKYKSLANNLNVGIFRITVGSEGEFLEANPAIVKMFGFDSREEFLKLRVIDLYKNSNERKKYSKKLLKEGAVKNEELELLKKDGTSFISSVSAVVVKNEENKVKFYDGIIEDITERKRVENELQESKALVEAVVENVPLMIFLKEATDLRFVIFNRAGEELLGYDRKVLLGKNDLDLFPPEQAAHFIAKDREVLDGTVDMLDIPEEPILTAQKGQRLLHTRKVCIRGADGEMNYLLGISEDITERKLAEESLKKSEKQFRNLFNSITDLIYTQDMEGRFISTNPAMHRLFGYDRDEFIGHSAADFMEPELQSGFASRYLEVIRQQKYHEGISCYFKKNKEKIYIEYRSFLVKPDDGGESYISGIGRDVTEKVLSEKKVAQLQKQVAQAQKMESIGTLAGGIAHDFNNILFPVLGHTEMLLGDVPEDSPFRNSLKEIYTSALRARDLVKQILTFSRQENSELKLMKIQPIIKEALKLIRSTIPTTIEIKQDINPDCGVIKADPTQIHQIVMNLTTNAYHAMEKTGGELKVCLKEIKLSEYEIIDPDMTPGPYACLTISDTGKGMDKELTQKIFDPFFTTKEKGRGTGMGLSMVHGIVNGMNGAIQVNSQPGKGTHFHVYLPIQKTLSEKQVSISNAKVQGGTEQVLLVDDEEAILTMEKQILERLGYQVTTRTSSLEALGAFRDSPNKFDLVITDMAMPNMPGDRLSVELTKIRPGIPVLICTGFSETMSEEKAASLGIKGFLLKPIVMRDLAQKIREVLDDDKS